MYRSICRHPYFMRDFGNTNLCIAVSLWTPQEGGTTSNVKAATTDAQGLQRKQHTC